MPLKRHPFNAPSPPMSFTSDTITVIVRWRIYPPASTLVLTYKQQCWYANPSNTPYFFDTGSSSLSHDATPSSPFSCHLTISLSENSIVFASGGVVVFGPKMAAPEDLLVIQNDLHIRDLLIKGMVLSTHHCANIPPGSRALIVYFTIFIVKKSQTRAKAGTS